MGLLASHVIQATATNLTAETLDVVSVNLTTIATSLMYRRPLTLM